MEAQTCLSRVNRSSQPASALRMGFSILIDVCSRYIYRVNEHLIDIFCPVSHCSHTLTLKSFHLELQTTSPITFT